MKLGTLTIHRALEFARANAPGKGLPYTEAQIELERELQRRLDEEGSQVQAVRHVDQLDHLATLFRRGVLRRGRGSAYR